nr:DUF4189 domain-containing protein [Stenotrophomonas rhizophila]
MLLLSALMLVSTAAFAEGRCPPGSYPIGDSRAPGCAPIPTGGGSDAAQGPVATGKWETRWGAISEDAESLATGASVSMKSKRQAVAAATAECKKLGGKSCKLRLAYYNQCAAIADATAESLAKGPGRSTIARAETVDQAKSIAMKECASALGGQTCEVVYSACSMSEFKAF